MKTKIFYAPKCVYEMNLVQLVQVALQIQAKTIQMQKCKSTRIRTLFSHKPPSSESNPQHLKAPGQEK